MASHKKQPRQLQASHLHKKIAEISFQALAHKRNVISNGNNIAHVLVHEVRRVNIQYSIKSEILVVFERWNRFVTL